MLMASCRLSNCSLRASMSSLNSIYCWSAESQSKHYHLGIDGASVVRASFVLLQPMSMILYANSRAPCISPMSKGRNIVVLPRELVFGVGKQTRLVAKLSAPRPGAQNRWTVKNQDVELTLLLPLTIRCRAVEMENKVSNQNGAAARDQKRVVRGCGVPPLGAGRSRCVAAQPTCTRNLGTLARKSRGPRTRPWTC